MSQLDIFNFSLKKSLMIKFNSFSRNALIIILFNLIAWVIIWPIGEFPINDDFAYNKDVINFIELGIISVHPWSAAIFLTQLVYGIVVAKVFGFSFLALRISVAVFALLGLLLMYKRFSQLASSSSALLIALGIMLNPLWLVYVNTFMTEVPFTILVFISFMFFSDYLKNGKLKSIFWAILFSMLSVLLRQFAILIPFSFFLFFSIKMLLNNDFSFKNVTLSFLPLLLTFFTFFIATYWISSSRGNIGEVSTKYDNIINTFSKGWLYVIKRVLFCIYAYLCYASLPFLFLLPLFIKDLKFFLNRSFLLVLSVSGLITFLLIKVNYRMPFFDGTIYKSGILIPVIDGVENDLKFLPFWNFITFLSVLSTNAFFYFIAKQKFSLSSFLNSASFFYFLFIASYLLLTSIIFPFDRYVLPIVPVIMLLVIDIFRSSLMSNGLVERVNTRIFLIGIVVVLFTIPVRDSFKVQRTRWELINDLLAKGVQANTIDGGFEYNGWYTYFTGKIVIGKDKNWWWVEDNKYILSYRSSILGYRIIDSRKTNTLVPFSTKVIYLFERI